MKTCGIYKITNMLDNKCYVGLSNNIEKRFYEHKRTLNNNEKIVYNPKFQHAWNKYGENNFKFETIHTCQESDLTLYEPYFIKKFKSYYKDGGYNMTKGGESMGYGKDHPCYGYTPWNKGKEITAYYGTHSFNRKQIIQYDKEGNFIKKWNSITEASKELKINRTSIVRCVKKNRHNKTAGGYIWQYKQ